MSLATLSSKILRSARTHVVRADTMRPMTVLSKQSAEEYKKQVRMLQTVPVLVIISADSVDRQECSSVGVLFLN